jgi:quercetin dioxygenase-like cupin family protein
MQRWFLPDIETPGGTLSPVVLTSENDGRAVLIELQPGQELGEHQVKEHAWLLVVEGSIQVSAGDDGTEALAGTLLRFEPDERHSVASPGGARILLLLAPWPGPGHYRGQELTGRAGETPV